jgi:malate permease and related proteins
VAVINAEWNSKMTQTALIVNRVLPILILIGLGYWIRQRQFLSESTVDDLRKIAVNLALPAVLFISFLEMDLKVTYLVIFVIMFVLCLALFGFGAWLKRKLNIQHEYFPFMMTGFEYGMLGVSLFGSAYGLERIGYIAVVDLGHEIFIWFVFLAFLLMKRDGLQRPSQLAAAFFKSPVIIGILAGIILNLLGASAWLDNAPVTGGILSTLRFLSGLTIPLILIIVGYGIKLDRQGLRESLLVIGVRMAIVLPLTLVLNRFLMRGLLGLAAPFEAALFTLLILPPPFIVPLYMRTDVPDERRYVNNVLTLYTVVSIFLFALYFVLNPGI